VLHYVSVALLYVFNGILNGNLDLMEISGNLNSDNQCTVTANRQELTNTITEKENMNPTESSLFDYFMLSFRTILFLRVLHRTYSRRYSSLTNVETKEHTNIERLTD
jgi:hypothetical protein